MRLLQWPCATTVALTQTDCSRVFLVHRCQIPIGAATLLLRFSCCIGVSALLPEIHEEISESELRCVRACRRKGHTAYPSSMTLTQKLNVRTTDKQVLVGQLSIRAQSLGGKMNVSFSGIHDGGSAAD